MYNDTTCYKPSGKTPLFFFIVFLVVVSIVIPVISYIYIHIIYFMPFVYLNIFAAIGCGAILGFFVSFAVKVGKARNVLLAVTASLLAVILMKYVMWTFYIPLVYSNAYGDIEYSFLEGLSLSAKLFINPNAVFEFVKEINLYGVWSIGKDIAVTGIPLYIIWFCEFCVLTFSCVVAVYHKARKPFCEDDNTWFKEKKNKIKLNMPQDIRLFKEGLMAMQYDELITLLNAPLVNSPEYISVQLYYLDDVRYGYVTINTVTSALDKKGKVVEKGNCLIEYLRIEGEVFTTLSDHVLLL